MPWVKKGRRTVWVNPSSTGGSTRKAAKKAAKIVTSPKGSFATQPAPAPKVAPSKPKRIERIQRQYRKGKRTLPGLDTEQSRIAGRVLEQGERAGATRKELVAAAETGLVETGFRNVPESQSDLDSAGWRQERGSIYGRGPKGHMNVRASAKRFFSETAEAGRGKGSTAGTLAQAVQRSAFPERYDQRRSEARKIVKAYTRGKRSGPKKLGGPWEGAQRAVLSKVPRSFRPEGRGDKRTPAENTSVGGSSTSDHLTTNRASYAADLPADDKLARRIAKNLGLKSHTGTQTVTKDGYRYQLIWQDKGHYDHIHLGAQWTGQPSSGGTASPATGTGGSAPGEPSPTAPFAGPTSRAGRSPAARRRNRERKRLLKDILSRRVYDTEESDKPSRARRTTRRTKVKLGL